MMKITCQLVLAFLLSLNVLADDKTPADFDPPLYVFYNGLGFGDIPTEAKTLKELGYDGISTVLGAGYGKLPQLVPAYQEEGMKVLSIYLNVEEKPLPLAFLQHLKNSGALAEVTVTKEGPNTVAALRESADMAQKLGIKVSLYPHLGFSVGTMSEAIAMVKKVNHPNLGLSFNLAHFLKGEDSATLENILTAAAPHLFCVNTNGANLTGTTWEDFIKPVQEGDFPQSRLVKALKEINYQGPVGFQCLGWKGDQVENLKLSIEAWNNAIADASKINN